MRLLRWSCAFFLAVLVTAAFGQEPEFVKVLVFDAGTKPSVAMEKPQYEFRIVYKHGMKDPDLLCDHCKAKLYPEPPAGPILVGMQIKQGIAYLCLNCKDLVWRDQGKQIEWTEESERAALDSLKRELSLKIPSSAIAIPQKDNDAKPEPAAAKK